MTAPMGVVTKIFRLGPRAVPDTLGGDEVVQSVLRHVDSDGLHAGSVAVIGLEAGFAVRGS